MLSCLEQYDASALADRSVSHFDTIVLRTDGSPSSIAKETSNEEKGLVYDAADSQYMKKKKITQKRRKELQVCRLVRVHRST